MAALAFVVVLAACGGGDDDSESVASLDDGADRVSTTIGRIPVDEALLEFSECMRDNGVDLPDIAIGPDGAPLIDPDLIEELDVGSPEFSSAFTTCLPIMASAEGFQQTADPEEIARNQDQLVALSQCMRDEGIDDFPDPDFDSIIPYPLSLADRFDDPEFDAAVEVCQERVAFEGFGP